MERSRGGPKRRDLEIWSMPLVAAGIMAGIAFIEVMTMPFGPRAFITLASIALFAGLLLIRKAIPLTRLWIVLASAAQTALALAAMLFGTSFMLGGILLFILCASLSNELPAPLVIAWNGVSYVAVFACSYIILRRIDWSVLPFCLGISAVSALAALLNRAREAKAESLRLLGELGEAQLRLRELAVVEERQRLARDIHDAVGYRLTASAMLLESAARLVPTDPSRAVRLIETSRDQVREGLADLRTAVRALREDAAGNLPLEEILKALVDVFSQSVEARVRLSVREGLPEPDTDRKLVLARSAQEALTNAQKHSGASRIELKLGFEDGIYEFECRDDGRGPGPASAPHGPVAAYGFGLGNLRARAAAFGGSAELLPAEGGGALLRLRLPARKEACDGSRRG